MEKLEAFDKYDDYTRDSYEDIQILKRKEDLMYSALSPEILDKINYKNLKNFPRYTDFYEDFESSNFCDEQELRNESLKKYYNEKKTELHRPMKIENLLENLKVNPAQKEFTLLFVDKISYVIQLFFQEDNKDKLKNALTELENDIKM